MLSSPATENTRSNSPDTVARGSIHREHVKRMLAFRKELAAIQAERPPSTSAPDTTSSIPSFFNRRVFFPPPPPKPEPRAPAPKPRLLITDDGSPMRALWFANEDTPPKQKLFKRSIPSLVEEPLSSISNRLSSGSASSRDEDSLHTLDDDGDEGGRVAIKQWDARSGDKTDEDSPDKLDDTRRFWSDGNTRDESDEEYDDDDSEAFEYSTNSADRSSWAYGDVESKYGDFVAGVDRAMDELMDLLNTMGLAPASEPAGPTPAEDMIQALVVDNADAAGEGVVVHESGDEAEDERSGQLDNVRRASARARRRERARRMSAFESNVGSDFTAFLKNTFINRGGEDSRA